MREHILKYYRSKLFWKRFFIFQISAAIAAKRIFSAWARGKTQTLWYLFNVLYQSLFTRRYSNSFAIRPLKCEILFHIGLQPSVSPSSDLNTGCLFHSITILSACRDSLITCRSGSNGSNHGVGFKNVGWWNFIGAYEFILSLDGVQS